MRVFTTQAGSPLRLFLRFDASSLPATVFYIFLLYFKSVSVFPINPKIKAVNVPQTTPSF